MRYEFALVKSGNNLPCFITDGSTAAFKNGHFQEWLGFCVITLRYTNLM